mmetsp:Transcript_21483/g.55315  ORF Transcript_21483/g.55315 Transcript_21483/m.55315 type:complete len:233 (+) Transcript_21483:54-752(+)
MSESRWARRLAAALSADDSDAFIAVYDALLDDATAYSVSQIDAIKELARTLAEAGLVDSGDEDDALAPQATSVAALSSPAQLAAEAQRPEHIGVGMQLSTNCDAAADGHHILEFTDIRHSTPTTTERGEAVGPDVGGSEYPGEGAVEESTPEATTSRACVLTDDNGLHRKRRRRKPRSAKAQSFDVCTQTELEYNQRYMEQQVALDHLADFLADRWASSVLYHARHSTQQQE